MALISKVNYRIAGGKAQRRNVVTQGEKTDLSDASVKAEVRKILADEHQVEPSQIRLMEGPPPAEPPKLTAKKIHNLNKSELVALIETAPELSGISVDATNPEMAKAIIARLNLPE